MTTSRRDFLRTTAKAAAIVALPLSLDACFGPSEEEQRKAIDVLVSLVMCNITRAKIF